MAGFQPPGGPGSVARREEVCSAISALSDGQLNRLLDYAQWRARALAAAGDGASDEDLLQGPITRTPSGDRRWNIRIGFALHLIGVICRISSPIPEKLPLRSPCWRSYRN